MKLEPRLRCLYDCTSKDVAQLFVVVCYNYYIVCSFLIISSFYFAFFVILSSNYNNIVLVVPFTFYFS